MATSIDWPVSLPQSSLIEGYREEKEDIVQRTKMEYGPDKLRKKYTSPISIMTYSLLLTKAQVQTLDSFYVSTLLRGALTFNIPNPRLGHVDVEAMVLDRPRYTPMSDVFFKSDLRLRYKRHTPSTTPVVPTGVAQHIATGQVVVTSSAAIIVAARATRKYVTLIHTGEGIDVYYGASGVDTITGVQLPNIPGIKSTRINSPDAVYAITASGTANISYVEVYD